MTINNIIVNSWLALFLLFLHRSVFFDIIKLQMFSEWIQKTSVKSAELGENEMLVRGRLKDEQKPETFNQLWTTEEQRKLEELLIEFPPERIEARRYRKIADRLGTKTLQQVLYFS